MTQITLYISRFNPETGEFPYTQTFEKLEFEPADTVLDALLYIRHHIDSSLTFRYSCQCTICGSCAMRINGKARLACETKIRDVAEDGIIQVEPLKNFTVIKDLVTDIEPLIAALRSVVPWLVRDHSTPLPEKEYIIGPEQISDTIQMLDKCILCGICHSDCYMIETDRSLISPAALIKALKLMLDPRDIAAKCRLQQIIELGLLKYPDELNIVCPKGINMTEDILKPMKLRAKMMRAS